VPAPCAALVLALCVVGPREVRGGKGCDQHSLFFLVTEMNFDTCRVFAVQVMERAEPANPPCS
jgi:hypothetical protein